jgi:hypothetical protein
METQNSSEALQKIAEFCNKYLAYDEAIQAYLRKRDILKLVHGPEILL